MTTRLLKQLKEEGYREGATLHKACAWKHNYPSCNYGYSGRILNRLIWVVSNWKDVTCKKCLEHKK